jgi:DNA-binding NarL/FixJ family response regulator
MLRIVASIVSNEIGRSDALQSVEAASDLSRALGFASWDHQILAERARAEYRASGIDATLATLAHFDVDREPMQTAMTAAWLGRVAVVEGHAAALERARELRSSIGGSAGIRMLDMHCEETDALLAMAAGGSHEAYAAFAQRWIDCDRPLEALRVQLTVGAHVLASGDRETARAILDATRKGLNECGASADADRAAALLRQTGARSRAKSRTTNVGPLTKRELEIARLVASGLKNSEVASTLFLAEKTVAAHLSNIYGKVEVRSRVQLTAWIRENDPEFETAVAAG